MKYPLDILLAGRSSSTLEDIRRILEEYGGLDLAVKLVANGHSDPLYNVQTRHEILIYVIGEDWEEGLGGLSQYPSSERPHTLVIGPDGDVAQYRAAMRAGARDYLTAPVGAIELANALAQIGQELEAQRDHKTAELTVVINTKGGSGASTIASNLAHIDKLELQKKVLLVDMDLQFGTIPDYLDLQSNNGLMKAFREVDDLDVLAIDGIALKHTNGMRVLAASQEELVLKEDIPVERVATLFELLGVTYNEIVVDMPRQIDAMNSLVLQHADNIVMVMEASLAHARDAKRLLQIFLQVMGLPAERIKIVINRYDKNGSVRTADIRNALNFRDIVTLPSDFKRVNDSLNKGIPLMDFARSAKITRSLVELARSLRAGDDRVQAPRRGSKLFKWASEARIRL